MWLHAQLCCSFTFAPISRYGYWSAISITLIEWQLDSLSRAAQAHVCIIACARACAYNNIIRREGYTGYTGLENTLERMQHATRLSLRLRDIARCAPVYRSGKHTRASSMRMSRSRAFRRAVYDFCACAALVGRTTSGNLPTPLIWMSELDYDRDVRRSISITLFSHF